MRKWLAVTGVVLVLGAGACGGDDHKAFCQAASPLQGQALSVGEQPSADTLASLRRAGELAPRQVDSYFVALAGQLDNVTTANSGQVDALRSAVGSVLADKCGIRA